MPDNYILLYELKGEGENHRKYYCETIQKITEDILTDKKGVIGKGNPIYNLLYNVGSRFFKNTDKKFRVSGCVNCKVCEDVCLVENIMLKDGMPTFSHNCEQCTACIQYCPAKAINYKNKTDKRRRYTNPNISLEERRNFYK